MLCFAGPSVAQPPEKPIREFDLATLQALGAAMYAQDQRAWVATDLMAEAKINMRGEGLIGWIDRPYGAGYRVRFLKNERAPVAVYDIVFVDGRKPHVEPTKDPVLSEQDMAQLRALETASSEPLRRCSDRPFNHIELPDPDGDGWLVWIMTPMAEWSALPIGGHTRFTISADGRKVEQADALSRSCLALNAAPTKDPKVTSGPNDPVRPVALSVSHIVSNTPIETHVFSALEAKLPIYVGTMDRKVWLVDGKSIQYLRDIPQH